MGSLRGHEPAGGLVGLTAYEYKAPNVNALPETWIEPNAACASLPTTFENVEPKVALAFHAVPGANALEMQQAFREARARGITFGVKPVAEPALASMAAAEGGVVVGRNWPGDCPNRANPDPEQEAELHYQRFARPPAGYPKGYWEPTNECAYEFSQSDWWLRFGCAWEPLKADGFKMVYPTYAPGHFNLTDIDGMRPLLDWYLANGGGIGYHRMDGGCVPAVRRRQLDSVRHRRFRAWLLAADAKYAGIDIL